MRNSKLTTDQTNQVLVSSMQLLSEELNYDTIEHLYDVIEFSKKIKKQGSFSSKSLKKLSDNIFLASVKLKHAEREILAAY